MILFAVMEIEVAVIEAQPAMAAVARGAAKWDNIPEVMIGLVNVAGHHGEGLYGYSVPAEAVAVIAVGKGDRR